MRNKYKGIGLTIIGMVMYTLLVMYTALELLA